MNVKSLLLLSAFCIAVVGCQGCSKTETLTADEKWEVGNVRPVSSDDAEMNSKISKAKANQTKALAALKDSKKTVFIKAAFEAPDGAKEHLWFINVKQLSKDVLEGELNNSPFFIETMTLGQRVKIKTSQISDWGIEDENGQREGFYTYPADKR